MSQDVKLHISSKFTIAIIVGIQRQQAKCWHNRSKFKQNTLI